MIYRAITKYDYTQSEFIKDFKKLQDAKDYIKKELAELKNPFRLTSITSAKIEYIKTCESDKKRRVPVAIIYCI